MTLERLIRFDGTIAEILPEGRFRVRFQNGHEVIAESLVAESDEPDVGDVITVEMPSHSSGSPRLFFRRLTQ